MNHQVKVAGTWRQCAPYVKVGSVWKVPNSIWVKVAGIWKMTFLKGGFLDVLFRFFTGTGANNTVFAVVQQPDGKTIVAGSFTSWDGTTVGRIVRLNVDGTRDTSFSTNVGTGANSTIYAVALQADGKIVVGGQFTSWDGVTSVDYIARLNSNGTRDTAFTTAAGVGPNNIVRAIAVSSSTGNIFVAGDFTTWSSVAVYRIVSLASNGSRISSFNTNVGTGANDSIHALAIQSDGKVIVGGEFTAWNGAATNRILRLFPTGVRDTSPFSTNIGTGPSGPVYAITLQPDGDILVGGVFLAWNGTTVNCLVRLSVNGIRDVSFNYSVGAGANNAVYAIAVQPNGGIIRGVTFTIIVGGAFTNWSGQSAADYIACLGSNGGWFPYFTVNSGTGPNSTIRALFVQSDNHVLVGGELTSWDGTATGRMVRVGGDFAF